jgi:hypothetical protein
MHHFEFLLFKYNNSTNQCLALLRRGEVGERGIKINGCSASTPSTLIAKKRQTTSKARNIIKVPQSAAE